MPGIFNSAVFNNAIFNVGVEVAAPSATPGHIRRIPGLHRVEDEAEKLARRIREGTIPAPVVPATEVQPAQLVYFKESARLAKAIAKAAAEAAETRAEIVALEAKIAAAHKKRREKLEHDLLLIQQRLTLLAVQESVWREELEAVEIAFIALVVIGVMQ